MTVRLTRPIVFLTNFIEVYISKSKRVHCPMKYLLLLCCGFFFSIVAQAQFVSDQYVIVDDMQERIFGDQSKLGKKAKSNPKNCGKDTMTYPYYKASRLVTISVSNGYSLGQFYEAPGSITIDGFEFYAWQASGGADTVTLYCHVYKAGSDSLPTGSPLRSDTLLIDSTFGGGALSALRQSAEFTSLKYDSAIVLVLSSNDTNRVAVVTNDWQANDGDLENLACGSISGLWYHFLDLNISGRTLNCDVLLHPYISYEVYNDFTFKDCYTSFDTVKLKNTSSPFYSSRMYNRYTFFNLEYFCHSWRYENRFYVRSVDGEHKYLSQVNDSVQLVSTLYTFTGGRTCIDTVKKGVSYMPLDVRFSGDRELCSGDFSIIRTNTNAVVEWFHSPTDTVPFLTNERYSTPDLYANDTFYAQAINGKCRTPLKMFAINVTEKPSQPVVKHDSVCLNSKANLSAKSSAGTMYWYSDSSNTNLVHTGEVLQTGNLTNDTSFFVRAENKQCHSDGFTRVNALVSKDFAPDEPKVVNDTNICLLDGMVNINASAVDPIRWYDVPSGGTPFQNGGSYSYSPTARGSHTVYVDAFDGRCASSRVPVTLRTLHFPTIPSRIDEKVCENESLLIEFPGIHGTIDWFEAPTIPNPLFTGTSRNFNWANDTQFLWLLPREDVCLDTVRHPFVLATTKEIHPDFVWIPSACAEDSLTLVSKHEGGDMYWMDEADTVVYIGNPYPVGGLKRQRTFKAYVVNDGCVGDTIPFPIEILPLPSSNYDFQINVFRTVLFQAKVANQGSYIWDFDDLGQTKTGRLVTHDFSDDGDFDVMLKVTTGDGCVDSTVKTIRLENTGSIGDVQERDFNIYPNPVQDELHIRLDAGHSYIKIEVLDALGRVIFTSTPEAGQSTNLWLNSAPLPQGTYLVRLIGEDVVITETLIKQ